MIPSRVWESLESYLALTKLPTLVLNPILKGIHQSTRSLLSYTRPRRTQKYIVSPEGQLHYMRSTRSLQLSSRSSRSPLSSPRSTRSQKHYNWPSRNPLNTRRSTRVSPLYHNSNRETRSPLLYRRPTSRTLYYMGTATRSSRRSSRTHSWCPKRGGWAGPSG